MNNTSAILIAHVRREIAELEAAAEAATLRPTSVRPSVRKSTTLSIRLDPDELTALERRAAISGIGTSTQARNLIRIGLRRQPGSHELAKAVNRVEAALAELRAALPAEVFCELR